MALDKKHFEVIPLSQLDTRKKEESQLMSFAEKIEWTTKLREYAYGQEATNGRLQRIYSVVKLGER